MADEISRILLLKQDIDFDTDGTGATVERDNPAGGTVTGHKVNASHIPTTTALRALMADTSTIENTLEWLYENMSIKDATTEQKGRIEIATLIEAKAGTDTVKAITPYLFKNTKASTSQFGTLLLASEAEALAGTNTEKAVTPATLKSALNAEASNIEHGMILSNNATDALNDIDVSAGKLWDSTYTYVMSLASAFTKRIDAVFEVGTGNGGFPSALTLTADTDYHFFAIYNPISGLTDFGFDTSLTATNLLADATGYTHYRYLGTVTTDGSCNIIAGIWTDLGGGIVDFTWDTKIQDLSTSSSQATYTQAVLSVPIGKKVKAKCFIRKYTISGVGGEAYFREAGVSGDQIVIGTGGGNLWKELRVDFITNTSSQIEWKQTSAESLTVDLLGYEYHRG